MNSNEFVKIFMNLINVRKKNELNNIKQIFHVCKNMANFKKNL